MVIARERSTTVQRRSTLQTINSHCKRHKKSILPATTAPHIQLNLTVKYSMRPTTAIAAAMSPSGSGCAAGAAAGRPAASDEAFCAARRRASLDNSRSSTSAATTPRGGSAALALLPRRFMARRERPTHTHHRKKKKREVCVCKEQSDLLSVCVGIARRENLLLAQLHRISRRDIDTTRRHHTCGLRRDGQAVEAEDRRGGGGGRIATGITGETSVGRARARRQARAR